MTCDEFLVGLTAFSLGELPREQAAAAREHVARCDACASAALRDRQLTALLRGSAVAAPRAVRRAVLSALRAEAQAGTPAQAAAPAGTPAAAGTPELPPAAAGGVGAPPAAAGGLGVPAAPGRHGRPARPEEPAAPKGLGARAKPEAYEEPEAATRRRAEQRRTERRRAERRRRAPAHAAPAGGGRRRHWLALSSVTGLAAALAAATILLVPVTSSASPLAAAWAAYRSEATLAATTPTGRTAERLAAALGEAAESPDLRAYGLSLRASGARMLAGHLAAVAEYRGERGERVALLRWRGRLPGAAGTQAVSGPLVQTARWGETGSVWWRYEEIVWCLVGTAPQAELDAIAHRLASDT